jgi:hypothetical protein
MISFIDQFRAARNAAVPIVAVETMDQQGTVASLTKAMNGTYPVIHWDAIRGFTPCKDGMEEALNELCEGMAPEAYTNASEALKQFTKNPPMRSILFFSNAHLWMDRQKEYGPFVSQAIANCRETLKEVGATLVLLSPGMSLPDELKQDVMVLSEPLPTTGEIEEVVKSLTEDFNLRLVADKRSLIEVPKDWDKVTDTLIGLSKFAAEQTFSTCLDKASGLNREALWERKCKAIEQTDGLSIYRGKEKFDDLGGCDNAKQFLRSILTGKIPPRCIVFMDEIEKMFAGAQGDSSGTSQDQLGQILTFMQDEEAEGLILVGPAGAAKSALSKAVGNEANIPTIIFDLNGMKDKFVGESGRKTRAALKVIKAISQGRMLFIATCNSISVLPPELRRRFALGTWFFDLPTADERKLIWNIYLKKYELSGPLPNDENWTGAEIRKCAQIAWRLNISLKDAASYIVPVAVSGKDKLDELRRLAAGKFINAGKPGIYQLPSETKQASGKRLIGNAN